MTNYLKSDNGECEHYLNENTFKGYEIGYDGKLFKPFKIMSSF
jgi:hypothetical protein